MAKIEVVHHQLEGGTNPRIAGDLYMLRRAGVTLKQVKITLEGDEATTERGALHYMYGRIEMKAQGPSVSGLIKSQLTGESVIRPVYRGNGVVFLEPTFSHIVLYELSNTNIVVDKGIYYASIGQVKVDMEVIKSLSVALKSDESLFHTKLSGKGTVALVSPVPENEIQKITLSNEKLAVDGSFAMLRTGDIKFNIERSTKSLFGTAASGEGYLQTFEGTGVVWLVPFQSVYDRLAAHGVALAAVAE